MNVRPGLFDGPPEPPRRVLRSLPRPAVYVTLGSVAVFSTPDLLAGIAAALAPHVASVVVTTGPNPVESLRRLPGNVQASPTRLRLHEDDREPAAIAAAARELLTDVRFGDAARELRAQVELLPEPPDVLATLEEAYG